MENASKALIIAGAILLSILLISLGIMVYNNAKGTVNDANLDAEDAQAFNTKFTQYGGTQRGTALNALLDAAITNNIKSGHKITTITITSGSGDSATTVAYTEDGTNKISSLVSYFSKSDTKEVSFGYTDGYVSAITIE